MALNNTQCSFYNLSKLKKRLQGNQLVRMIERNRKTGSEVVGDVPWGSHFCQFYQTPEDLTDILVPYFSAGLENNEFCVWVTSEPLNEKAAKAAISRAVPDFEQYLKKGQMQIVPHADWYLKDGVFNSQRVVADWVNKLDQALTQGYDGLRVTGNAAWLEEEDWRAFSDYETKINKAIGKYRILAICSYSIDKCDALKLIEVAAKHQFALIKQATEWELIENPNCKRAMEALLESEAKYRSIFESAKDAFIVFDSGGNILEANPQAIKLYGYSREELLGINAQKLIH